MRFWKPTLLLFLIGLGTYGFVALPADSKLKRPETWQAFTNPGPLSAAHANIEGKCATCHTPNKRVEAADCIVCHSNSESLLQRQPTAFHSTIGRCSECHFEHQGRERRLTTMNHEALAEIGLKRTNPSARGLLASASLNEIADWVSAKPSGTQPTDAGGPPHLSMKETLLNCNTCHANQDVHRAFFGTSCGECHSTSAWTIAEYRHPSAASRDCAQCHQAPPSHTMMHFQMVSMMVAGQPHAKVNQCFLCHQTTAWNDIRGVGWYKHH